MKKQINPTIKAHLIRSAFYLLLLVAVCAIPFALAQRNTAKPSIAQPKTATSTGAAHAQSAGLVRLPGVARFSAAAQGHRRVAKMAARLLHPLFVNSVYMLDDGTAEDGVGFGNGSQNFESLWFNQFDVIPGQTMIST